MSSLWSDESRREILVAAVLGAVWAVVGLTLAARGSEAASCRIQNQLGNGTANVGSGTLVDVTDDGRSGLVLTCAHLFSEGRGRVLVALGQQSHHANLVAIDPRADLAALEIATPQVRAAPIALDFTRNEPLTACGFGPRGQFRCISGEVLGAAGAAGQESIQIRGAVRSGDSGGGVFDQHGRLVAVVWGEGGGVTYASTGAPLRSFLQRVLGARLQGVAAAPFAGGATGSAMPLATCPDGRCPIVRPGPYAAPPAGRGPAAGVAGGRACTCGGDCDAQLAAIAARLDALAGAKQDRGDYALRDELTPLARNEAVVQLDQQHRARHESLLARIEGLAPAVGAAGRVAAPLAVTALGISGPAGWGVLAAAAAGSWLVGRRLRRRGEKRASQSESAQKHPPHFAAPSALPTHPTEATAAADHTFRLASAAATHAPIERDDREARELLRLSQLEGRDPLQDALAGRIALDRLDALAESDADPQRARLADDLRRELRERFNEIAPTKFQVSDQRSAVSFQPD